MYMEKRLRIVISVMLLTLMIIVTACSGNGSKVTPEESVKPSETIGTEPIIEPTPLPFTASLTGIKRETDVIARPIVVMINNFAAARPQSGLTNADVVWEVLAEGGITRLIAVFQSTDALTDTIGPVRSIRPYLIDIADSFGAVMVHAGGSNDGYAILRKQGKPYLDEISNAGSYFWRSKERKAPHNLYSTLEKMRAGAEKKKYSTDKPVPTYTFSESGAAEAGSSATDISINFLLKNYKVGYIYDETNGLYKRSIGDKPHIDMNNDQQLSAANLVVLGADHKTLDNEGRLAVDMTSGGQAILFQKGKVIEAEWLRAPDGMIRIVKNGTELPFTPGKTYFHIVPNSPTFAGHISWVQN